MEGCEVGAVDGLWTHLISGWASPYFLFAGVFNRHLSGIASLYEPMKRMGLDPLVILQSSKNAARLNLMPHDDESCGL